MKDYLIVVAGGSGSRMNSPIPKQFIELSGLPIVMHTLHKFHRYNPQLEVVLALHTDYLDYWDKLCAQHHFHVAHRVVPGGAERFYSVKQALDSIEDSFGIVAVHDAVRPFVSLRTIEACYDMARQHCIAVPVIKPSDSVRIIEEGRSSAADRRKFRLVQTPQCFELSLLRQAYAQPFQPSFTDDAAVVEALGETVCLVEGNRENFKITTPEDLRMAEAMMAS